MTCESTNDCGRPEHLRGLCRECYVSRIRAENSAKHPDAWTAEDDRRLIYILDSRPDGLGYAAHGELEEIARVLGRTKHATGQRLTTLRRIRKQRQNADILSRATA